MAEEPQAAEVAAPEPPAIYDLILGEVVVEQNNALTNEATIQQILHWIGFRNGAIRENLRNDSLGSFEELQSLTEKDVQSISTDWAGRTANHGRFYMGSRRLKYLQSLIHWVQDFRRVSKTPTIVGLNENTFKSQLSRALDRAIIRKTLMDQSTTASAAASPGPLDSERKWKHWEEKFVNFTASHLGSYGIPLSYVIRENDDPATDKTYGDFITETIYCAPLQGEFYTADRMTVFNMIISFTTGQPSADWIKPTIKHNDGRRSMKALRAHFSGEGNASRNKAEADRLKEALHYKGERAMTFESFLTQCQRMYNIYEKEKEAMSEDAKIRFLFKKVQHPNLQSAIEALKARLATNDAVTYTQAANHLSTAVSELPEFLAKNRNICGVNSGTTTTPTNTSSGIYNADGSIITGHIPTWRSLSLADRNLVFAERERLGIGKGSKGSNGKGNFKAQPNANSANRLKQLTETNKRMKRQIKVLKRKPNDDSGDQDDEEDSTTDAGDQFGGKASKKSKKNK